MNFYNAIAVGLKEIWANKFRSLLTMLGIILGVSSLVAMSALVKGMENGMKEALIAIGGLEKVRVEEQDIPVWQQHMADQAVGTTMSDVHALLHSAPLITMAFHCSRELHQPPANDQKSRRNASHPSKPSVAAADAGCGSDDMVPSAARRTRLLPLLEHRLFHRANETPLEPRT